MADSKEKKCFVKLERDGDKVAFFFFLNNVSVYNDFVINKIKSELINMKIERNLSLPGPRTAGFSMPEHSGPPKIWLQPGERLQGYDDTIVINGLNCPLGIYYYGPRNWETEQEIPDHFGIEAKRLWIFFEHPYLQEEYATYCFRGQSWEIRLLPGEKIWAREVFTDPTITVILNACKEMRGYFGAPGSAVLLSQEDLLQVDRLQEKLKVVVSLLPSKKRQEAESIVKEMERAWENYKMNPTAKALGIMAYIVSDLERCCIT